jgi:hypothetical protein
MKNIIKNEKGQAQTILSGIMIVIMGFAMLTVGGYVIYAVASALPSTGMTVTSSGQYASGSFAFNGQNVTNLETVTITNGAGVYLFEFNTSNYGVSSNCVAANCILVNLSNTNKSLNAATNLTTAINANITTAALVTATLSGNTSLISADTIGTTANSIVLTKNTVSVTATGLSGGIAQISGTTNLNSIMNYVSTTMPLFGLALMILGFSIIFITLRRSMGSSTGRT